MIRSTTTLAIVSGKGGVGKSVVAVNLAESLAAQGLRVALVDADLGQGACAILMNEAPSACVLDAVLHRATPEALLHRTAAGVTLVSAVDEAGRADGRESDLYGALDALLTRLRRQHDVVLIDTPAGVDGPVRWALDRADLGLMVLVGEPTAVSDAYRLAKLVWKADAAFPLGLVVNFADGEADAASVAERFSAVTERFTGQVPLYLGGVPFSNEVRQSVLLQSPAARHDGPARQSFLRLAETLVAGRRPVAALAPVGAPA